MAHICPECGQACYCNGDVDDCLNDLPEDSIRCIHWMQCELEDIEDDYIED